MKARTRENDTIKRKTGYTWKWFNNKQPKGETGRYLVWQLGELERKRSIENGEWVIIVQILFGWNC